MSLRISFVGDVCLQDIDSSTFSIDPGIAALAESSALTVANLECPLTTAHNPIPYKAVHLKAAPCGNRILNLFNAFSLANNHILDYREQGLIDTIDFLRTSNKRWFGAGRDIDKALCPLTLEIGDFRIALLSFTRWSNATRRSAGAAPDRIDRITKTIRGLSQDRFFVVVYPHWNYEYVDFPAPSNRRAARRLVDAGADLVVGSHPHVIQGYETYRGKLIFHSLGNFVFQPGLYAPEERDDQRINYSFMVSIDLRPDKTYRYTLHPVYTDDCGVKLLTGAEQQRFFTRLETLSQVLKDDRLLRKYFYRGFTQGKGIADQGVSAMVKRQGIMYLLSRMHKLRFQDVQIKLHTLLQRLVEQGR